MVSEHCSIILHEVYTYTHRSVPQSHREGDASNKAGAGFNITCW